MGKVCLRILGCMCAAMCIYAAGAGFGWWPPLPHHADRSKSDWFLHWGVFFLLAEHWWRVARTPREPAP